MAKRKPKVIQKISQQERAERAEVEEYFPGLRCIEIDHNPNHWSGYERIEISMIGTAATFQRHRLLTKDMTTDRPRRGYEIWSFHSRELIVDWLPKGFEVTISNYGESIKTVRDVLRSVYAKKPPASEIPVLQQGTGKAAHLRLIWNKPARDSAVNGHNLKGFTPPSL